VFVQVGIPCPRGYIAVQRIASSHSGISKDLKPFETHKSFKLFYIKSVYDLRVKILGTYILSTLEPTWREIQRTKRNGRQEDFGITSPDPIITAPTLGTALQHMIETLGSIQSLFLQRKVRKVSIDDN
jgi:hypothetical protein